MYVDLKDFGRKGLSVPVDLLDSHVAHDCPLVTLHRFQTYVCHLQIWEPDKCLKQTSESTNSFFLYLIIRFVSKLFACGNDHVLVCSIYFHLIMININAKKVGVVHKFKFVPLSEGS